MRSRQRRVFDGLVTLGLALSLGACGGGSTATGGSTAGAGNPSPTPSGACALRARQDWVLAQFNNWYLFPETLTYVNPAAFSNLSDYVDALTAGARAQGKDRYFTYVTSIADENAYYQSGQTAGFGIRLFIEEGTNRLLVSEAFEGAPALDAGIDRGTQIVAIGTSSSNLRTVSSIVAAEGQQGIYNALGPNDVGTTRVLTISDAAGQRTVTLAKRDFDIQPVSPRYGLRIIDDNGRKVGYINLRTFIYSAEPQLRTAFAQLRAQGIKDVIVDLRYNGGGLVSVGQTLASLLGGARRTSDLVARLTFRPEHSVENESYYFTAESASIAPDRIAFIASHSTASASEFVINAFNPFMPSSIALIGDNTYGKPVGQIALDKSECDDRLRLIAFAVQNGAGTSNYYNGLAPFMARTCRARDELTRPLGDPAEDSVARALDFLDGRSCAPISEAGTTRIASADRTAIAPEPVLRPLVPHAPSQPQRDMPGFF